MFENKKNCYLTRNCRGRKEIANDKARFSQCGPQTSLSITWNWFDMQVLEPHPRPNERKTQFWELWECLIDKFELNKYKISMFSIAWNIYKY